MTGDIYSLGLRSGPELGAVGPRSGPLVLGFVVLGPRLGALGSRLGALGPRC